MRLFPKPIVTPPMTTLIEETEAKETGGLEAVRHDLPHTTFPLWNIRQFFNSAFWYKWHAAFKAIWPVYLAVHLALFAISCLAFLFPAHDFSPQILPVYTLWHQWLQWDAHFYVTIALQGYTTQQQMAFFPLYPLLVRGAMLTFHRPIVAGIVVSNTAELAMFMILYRLVEKDFGAKRAYYTILYLALWPSAFFLSGIYTESLFLCLSTLTFYQLRHGRWFLAAICACFASLTRPDGMFLVIPFLYEYLRRIWLRQDLSPHEFFTGKHMLALIRGIRWDILCGLGFFGGVLIFMGYGFLHNHDPLAFVHAHNFWARIRAVPGYAMLTSAQVILQQQGFMSFTSMRNLLDLGHTSFSLLMIILIFAGPLRFSPKLWGYGLYALALFLYFETVPMAGPFPLESIERFLLEIFPTFILLSGLHKYRSFHLSYCLIAGALLFFMLTQYLNHHWIT